MHLCSTQYSAVLVGELHLFSSRWLTTSSIVVGSLVSSNHVRRRSVNGSIASSSEEEHNVWNPLLDTLVEYQTGPLLLSFLEDTEAARLGFTSRLALDNVSLKCERAQRNEPTRAQHRLASHGDVVERLQVVFVSELPRDDVEGEECLHGSLHLQERAFAAGIPARKAST